MLNQYPLWKNILVVLVVIIGIVYALPNLYGEDPVVQVSPKRAPQIDATAKGSVEVALKEANVPFKRLETVDRSLVITFSDTEDQLKAQSIIGSRLGNDYIVAMNLAPATPAWLKAINALPMFLGLDLRGGVHFLIEVDMTAALANADERYVNDFRGTLRDKKIRYVSVRRRDAGGVEVKFRDAADLQAAREILHKEYNSLFVKEVDSATEPALVFTMSEQDQREVKRLALQQNITTLRNRVNELGVAEPLVQQQGLDRIVVQLPGIQDPTRAKEILGATATLEYRLVDEEHSAADAVAGKVPPGARLYKERNGNPILLQKRVIVTGDQITDAASGIDSNDGGAAVFINLDGSGAKKMLSTTKENVGKLMAVVFIESKTETKTDAEGKTTKVKTQTEEVINVARIREPFGKRFQTTGLDSTEEARNLALLLRAGALSAPIEIVEERTVGPSLGKDNIDQGVLAAQVGFVVVVIFMVIYYRVFGMLANIGLVFNLVLLVAILSMVQATLTLPGIAGIVLTLGMAVDANVLINERIREELRNGNSPQASIHAGFERAFATIADANITTLIAAVLLFGFGSGPIKGFAVTLTIGIATSMFTAVMVTRAMVNWIYGGRKVEKLAV